MVELLIIASLVLGIVSLALIFLATVKKEKMMATNRKVLPARRDVETLEMEFAGKRYSVSIGFDSDGATPVEVFISGTKAGSDFESVARDGAVILSIALQYDVPLAALASAITRDERGNPMSIVGKIVTELAAYEPLDRCPA